MAGTIESVVPLTVPGVERLEEIGHGGFSVVYRGWQPAHERWVAIKVLRDGAGGLAREARALGSLSEHPNVVALHASGEVDGHPYLVMPYLSGGSLQDRIDAGPLDPRHAAATIAAVAAAVEAAHRRDLLHRDIKPANILFTSYGVPQLADFGIARMADSTLTQTGAVAATVAYTAPEVLAGGPATPLSDVYALGATLDAALRGGPAFAARDGEPAIGLAVRVVRDEVPPLAAPGVPPALAALAARAMAKDPAHRPPSAAALRAELEAVASTPAAPTAAVAPAVAAAAAEVAHRAAAPVAGRAAPVARPAVGPPTPRARRRRLVLAGAAAALVVAAAAGTAAATSGGGGVGASSAGRPGSSSTAGGPAAAPATSAPAAAHPTTTHPTITQAPTTAPASPKATVPAAASATAAPGSAAGTGSPPSAGGATDAAAVAPSTLETAVTRYYGLVDHHDLDQSWTWLSAAFQGRIGHDYYRSFWGGVSSVEITSVTAAGGTAEVGLRETASDGTVTTERDELGYVVDGSGHLLIDTDQVVG
ncbi:MAG TPA: serine/threonine-protein kinase [Acidimicrobiales bacterium]|nr:serine/threonine-protein kinase [Acidimicrobiales bacterium]